MLAASKLETSLRKYLKNRKIPHNPKSTLGNLVFKLEENNLLSFNGKIIFTDLAKKRNYLAHSLYDLFTKEIEETILEREDLTEGDTDIFIYRARQLARDFLLFSEIVEKANIKTDKLM